MDADRRPTSPRVKREIITFEVGGQLFGMDIVAIREIRAWSPVTRMPGVPPYVAGMANLRGAILPVIDLAARLGWQTTEASERHAIIVVHVDGHARGLLVEAVSDLVEIEAGSLQPPPAMGDVEIIGFIEGLAPVGYRMLQVLNIASIVAS